MFTTKQETVETPEQWKIWLRLTFGPAMVLNPWFRFWLDVAKHVEEQHQTTRKPASSKK